MQAGYPQGHDEICTGGSGGFKAGREPWSVNILIHPPSKNIPFSKVNILTAFK